MIIKFYGAAQKIMREEIFQVLTVDFDDRTRSDLCSLMSEYGSDKGNGWHNYTLIYQELFSKNREIVKNVLEIGIGTNNPNLPSSMGTGGVPGASLRAWQKYFVNAQIFGCDIDSNTLFIDERIRTFQLDQTNVASIERFKAELPEGIKFDLIIDDGLHEFHAAITLLPSLFSLVSPGGYYVIEDVDLSPGSLELYDSYLSSSNLAACFIAPPNEKNRVDNALIIIKNDVHETIDACQSIENRSTILASIAIPRFLEMVARAALAEADAQRRVLTAVSELADARRQSTEAYAMAAGAKDQSTAAYAMAADAKDQAVAAYAALATSYRKD